MNALGDQLRRQSPEISMHASTIQDSVMEMLQGGRASNITSNDGVTISTSIHNLSNLTNSFNSLNLTDGISSNLQDLQGTLQESLQGLQLPDLMPLVETATNNVINGIGVGIGVANVSHNTLSNTNISRMHRESPLVFSTPPDQISRSQEPLQDIIRLFLEGEHDGDHSNLLNLYDPLSRNQRVNQSNHTQSSIRNAEDIVSSQQTNFLAVQLPSIPDTFISAYNQTLNDNNNYRNNGSTLSHANGLLSGVGSVDRRGLTILRSSRPPWDRSSRDNHVVDTSSLSGWVFSNNHGSIQEQERRALSQADADVSMNSLSQLMSSEQMTSDTDRITSPTTSSSNASLGIVLTNRRDEYITATYPSPTASSNTTSNARLGSNRNSRNNSASNQLLLAGLSNAHETTLIGDFISSIHNNMEEIIPPVLATTTTTTTTNSDSNDNTELSTTDNNNDDNGNANSTTTTTGQATSSTSEVTSQVNVEDGADVEGTLNNMISRGLAYLGELDSNEVGDDNDVEGGIARIAPNISSIIGQFQELGVRVGVSQSEAVLPGDGNDYGVDGHNQEHDTPTRRVTVDGIEDEDDDLVESLQLLSQTQTQSTTLPNALNALNASVSSDDDDDDDDQEDNGDASAPLDLGDQSVSNVSNIDMGSVVGSIQGSMQGSLQGSYSASMAVQADASEMTEMSSTGSLSTIGGGVYQSNAEAGGSGDPDDDDDDDNNNDDDDNDYDDDDNDDDDGNHEEPNLESEEIQQGSSSPDADTLNNDNISGYTGVTDAPNSNSLPTIAPVVDEAVDEDDALARAVYEAVANVSNNMLVRQEQQVVTTSVSNDDTGDVTSAVDTPNTAPSTEANTESASTDNIDADANASSTSGLQCPPGYEEEIFYSLPEELQREILQEHGMTHSNDEIAELVAFAGFDAETLNALPDAIRQEVLDQARRDRDAANVTEPAADESNAQEMDNASFLASLTSELRTEVLMTADDQFLSTLPPPLVAEAHVLRDRAAVRWQAEREAQMEAANAESEARSNSAAVSSPAGTRATRSRRTADRGERGQSSDTGGISISHGVRSLGRDTGTNIGTGIINATSDVVDRNGQYMVVPRDMNFNSISTSTTSISTNTSSVSAASTTSADITTVENREKVELKKEKTPFVPIDLPITLIRILHMQTLPVSTALVHQLMINLCTQQKYRDLLIRILVGLVANEPTLVTTAINEFGSSSEHIPTGEIKDPNSNITGCGLVDQPLGRTLTVLRRLWKVLAYLAETNASVIHDLLSCRDSRGGKVVAGPNRLVKLLKPQIDKMKTKVEADARCETNNDEVNDGSNGDSNGVEKDDEVKDSKADDGDIDLSLSSIISLSTSRQNNTSTTSTDATNSLLELLIQGCSDPSLMRSSEDLSMALSLIASLCEPLEAYVEEKERKPSESLLHHLSLEATMEEEQQRLLQQLQQQLVVDGEMKESSSNSSSNITTIDPLGDIDRFDRVSVPKVQMSRASLESLCDALLSDSSRDVFDHVICAISRLAKVIANRRVLTHVVVQVTLDLARQSSDDMSGFLMKLKDRCEAETKKTTTITTTSSNSSSNSNSSSSSTEFSSIVPTSPSTIASTPIKRSISNMAVSAMSTSSLASFDHILRALQTLDSLANKINKKLTQVAPLEHIVILWDHLDEVLEYLSQFLEDSTTSIDSRDSSSANQSSLISVLTRLLPVIEAFFLVHATDILKSGSQLQVITVSNEEASVSATAIDSSNESAGAALGSPIVAETDTEPNATASTSTGATATTEEPLPAPVPSDIEIPVSTTTDETTTSSNTGEPSPSTLNRNTMVALRRAHSLPGEKYRDTESFRSLNVPLILSDETDADSNNANPNGTGSISLKSATSSFGFGLARTSSSRMVRATSKERMKMSVGPQRLLYFTNLHGGLLNLLIQSRPALLDTTFAALLRVPQLRASLDFENKRNYFFTTLRNRRPPQRSSRRSVHITVRRDLVFEDSFHQLRMRNAEEMRGRLVVHFQGEEGIDAGGVSREWYRVLAREIFNPNYALFAAADQAGSTFQPNPLSYYNSEHLHYFKFVGRVIGKAMVDAQLLDAHFTRSFYKHLLGVEVDLSDVEAIEPDYYKSLQQMLEYPLDMLGLDLTFSADSHVFGKHVVVDLIPGGRNIAVTDTNKPDYVRLLAHHRMTTAIRVQIESFLEGFYDIVPSDLVSIFSPTELELLICGVPEIDIAELKANTEYHQYRPTDQVIVWFWEILNAMSQEDKALFLQFVTGTSKVPLEGFANLQGMRGVQRFSIHKDQSSSTFALPQSHTCFNQLVLPPMESKDELRDKLLMAIRECSEGFGFA